MGDRIFTSEEAEETLKELGFVTSMEFGALGRLALAVSLNETGSDVPRSDDDRGKEIRDRTLFGTDTDTYRALIQQVHGRRFDEDEFVSRSKSVVKDHVDHGCSILRRLLEDADGDPAAFYAKLAGELEAVELPIPPIAIEVGQGETGTEPIRFELNNMHENPNPHLALMGKSGAGKTQSLLKILADIRTQTEKQTHFVLFDYKGDIADNESFVNATAARVFRLPEDRLPINPFVLDRYDDNTIAMAARAKAESFASAQARLGVVQKGQLTDGIIAAYEQRASADRHYPDLREVADVVQERYEREGRKADSLTEVLRDLSRFGLFWEHGDNSQIIEDLTATTIVINLSHLEMLRELVAYMVIEQLYREMSSLGESAINDPYREIRTVLVIDEAHHYLGQNNPFLQRVIREGRSNGVAVFLASQSPSDYVGAGSSFNYLEHIEIPLVFASDGVSKKAAREILGSSEGTASHLPTEIARLKTFQFLTRSDQSASGYIVGEAHPFYEAYGG